MRLRYWITEALSGDVVGEVRAAGGVSLSSRFGGGTCRVPISLSHLVTRDGTGMDTAAVANALNMTRPGLHGLAVTDHQKRCLGEWVLMRRSRSTASGVVNVEGMEWAGYPALRSLNDDFVYTSTDQLQIARALLQGAFTSYNAGMQITIPSMTSGVNRAMEHRAQSAYFSDALEEISAPDNGFEWHVDIAPVWSGDRLLRVSRTVVIGQPVLSSPTDIVVEAAQPGSRRGNGVIDGGEDFSRYAQSVYGIGDGEGSKRLVVGLSDPTLTNAGYLNSTKNVQFPGVKSTATLTALTQAELTRAQDLRDPFAASALLEKLPALPRVGDRVRLRSEATWGFPEGLNTLVRVGEVAYSPSGHSVQHVAVQVA